MKKNKLKLFSIHSNLGMFAILAGVIGFSLIPINAQSAKQSQQNSNRKRWTAPARVDSLINPITQVNEVGTKLFQQACAICHGNKGKGDGVAGVALKPRPANLTDETIQQQSDGALFWKISVGKTPMPAYENVYTEDQRWRLVKFIRTLKRNKR